ncbi:hypothetical protein LTR84_008876 [Exophiala bonariae]|uniref:4-coumarate-CoA ligase n=1 Tax=Exophiala bonariae TaxID=1690606 RepID=A0AAV9MW58_9EURO|nr:hypothetical protein LTR84_008876 [Exophiala bonariae]
MAKRYDSPYKVHIPPIDVATFVFSSDSENDHSSPQYFDADRPERNFSLQQAKALVKRVGKGLLDLRLKPDDKVLLYSGNSLYFPILFWGTVSAGCVFTGCSPSASVTELSYQLRDSNATLVITSSAGASRALEAASQVGIPKDRVFEFVDPDKTPTRGDILPWTNFWASEEGGAAWEWRKFSTVDEAQTTTAVVNYSSGTTGVPKGVEISHYNIVSNCLQVIFKRNMIGETSRAKERKQRIEAGGERWLAPLPMFHAYGQMYYSRMGVKVFIMMEYSIQRYLLFLDIYRITFLTGVPTLMVALSKHPQAESFNLKSIESVVTGSAPLNPEIGRLVEKTHLRPGVQVKQGWGMTETTCSATGFAQDDEDDGRSIGWLNPNVSAKIVPMPEHGFEQTPEIPYVVGEIWVSGPNIMRGYYKKAKETSETIVYEDGLRWLRTGDIGYVDSRGCFYIVDRMKELIKVKGLQVAPAEIEQVLLTHHAIADAAVIGEKRPAGEYPKAFVVRAPGTAVSAREIERYIETRMSRHKWLTAGVHFIDTIPRTPSGKVIRRELQKLKTASVDGAAKL